MGAFHEPVVFTLSALKALFYRDGGQHYIRTELNMPNCLASYIKAILAVKDVLIVKNGVMKPRSILIYLEWRKDLCMYSKVPKEKISEWLLVISWKMNHWSLVWGKDQADYLSIHCSQSIFCQIPLPGIEMSFDLQEFVLYTARLFCI